MFEWSGLIGSGPTRNDDGNGDSYYNDGQEQRPPACHSSCFTPAGRAYGGPELAEKG